MDTGREVDPESESGSVEEYLKLLEAISNAGIYPEKFADLCQRWAERPKEAKTFVNFEKLLNVVYKQSTADLKFLKPENLAGNLFTNDHLSKTSFTIDTDLEVVSIGDKAETILGVSLGDTANDLFDINLESTIQAVKANPRDRKITEVFASDGSRHSAYLVQVVVNGHYTNFFRFTLNKIEIADGPQGYIRDKFKLTQAELDVLNLILQRLSIPKIADTRQSTTNTVRTQIRSIKNKFQSRSLTDVILSVQEIITFHEEDITLKNEAVKKHGPVHRNTILTKIPASDYQVEYSRYGDPQNAPLIILHSIEYGVAPPTSFVSEAIEAGYCVYIPMRPGFGRSSVSDSIEESAEILEGLLRTLRLRNVTLIAFSTSAPTAISLLEIARRRIVQTIFVNYGFNTENKIKHIQPVWLRGLLEFSLGSSESFKFAWRMTKSMLRLIGYKNFYKKLYHGCEEDLEFLDENLECFKISSTLLQTASAKACKNDLSAAFLPNKSVRLLARKPDNIFAVFGSHTHGISVDPIRQSTEALGLPFHVIENSGRHCIYHRPREFFRLVSAKAQFRQAV